MFGSIQESQARFLQQQEDEDTRNANAQKFREVRRTNLPRKRKRQPKRIIEMLDNGEMVEIDPEAERLARMDEEDRRVYLMKKSKPDLASLPSLHEYKSRSVIHGQSAKRQRVLEEDDHVRRERIMQEESVSLLHNMEIVRYLKQNRGPHTLDALAQALGFPIRTNEALYTLVRNNPRIDFDVDTQVAEYDPQIAATNKEELLQFMSTQTHPVLRTDIADTYTGVEEDLEELLRDRKLVQIVPHKRKREGRLIAFIGFQVEMDKAFVNLWHNVEVPNPKIIDEYLEHVGVAAIRTKRTAPQIVGDTDARGPGRRPRVNE